MRVSVTSEHIAIASTFPYTSPVALAIGEGAIANHVAVYVKGDRYELPAIARQNEIAFDYYRNCKGDQGKHLEAIAPYEFELCQD
jgi:hypothetical protein